MWSEWYNVGLGQTLKTLPNLSRLSHTHLQNLKGMANDEESVHWVPRTQLGFSRVSPECHLLVRTMVLNVVHPCSSEPSVDYYFFKTLMCESYIQLAKSEFWGADTKHVYITKLPVWFWAAVNVENLCSRETYHWDGVGRSEEYLIRESRHQDVSHHPSTEGTQKKWGALMWSGKIGEPSQRRWHLS